MTPTRHNAEGASGLTPTERRIARLAKWGVITTLVVFSFASGFAVVTILMTDSPSITERVSVLEAQVAELAATR
jgi:hypothetical protein